MLEKEAPLRRQEGRSGGAAEALIALDKDLMKLLVRRATLVARLREGRDHASSPAAIQAEKAVRIAFEANAAAFSKDPRFTGKFFSLLQDLSLFSKQEAERQSGFVLSPPRKPVQANLPGPVSDRAVRMWMTLAAMSGAPLALSEIALCEAVLAWGKILNQAGGLVQWPAGAGSSAALSVAGGSIPALAGKTLFLGEDLFNLHLACFMAVHQPGIIRLTGGAELKEADLSGLGHVLPLLGARLAHVIPHSRGLPASLECSGLLPESLTLPADLPLEGVCALFLAPLVWNKPMKFNFSLLPADVAAAALMELSGFFAACSAQVESGAFCLSYAAQRPLLPESPILPLEPALSAYLLALPAFAGGKMTLKGRWPADLPQAQEALTLLRRAGLRIELGLEGVSAVQETDPAVLLPPDEPTPALLPLAAAIFARSANRGQGWEAASPENAAAVQSFFACLGLSADLPDPSRRAKEDSPKRRSPPLPSWICPSACWGLALALASFVRPGIRLANPEIVSRVMPSFWPMFNSLPHPGASADPPVAEKPGPSRTNRRIKME